MDTIINIIIVIFIINAIYRAIKQFEKQQQNQSKVERKVPIKRTEARIPDTPLINTFQAHPSSVGAQKLKKKRKKPSREQPEEEGSFTLDLATLDLVRGIIMSEILAPPLAKRRHFGGFSQRE